MIKLRNLINESTLDKGIFKSVFFAGVPGAGKSYTISKITDGNIEPRIVNFDKYAEFLTKKYLPTGFDAGMIDSTFCDTSKRMTSNQLTQYINSMLPLFVDSTGNKATRTMMRNGILKYFGYDTAMIWINTDIEVALERIKKRNRSVPEDFVRNVNNSMKENIDYYKKEFGNNFIQINNNDGELTDSAIKNAYNKVSQFFKSPIENPIGRRNFDIANKSGGYLIPSVFNSSNEINSKLTNWY